MPITIAQIVQISFSGINVVIFTILLDLFVSMII